MDGRFARALRRLVPALAVLLGANVALSDAGEADISPDVLDELESTICIAASSWTNSLEEHAKRQSIPVLGNHQRPGAAGVPATAAGRNAHRRTAGAH